MYELYRLYWIISIIKNILWIPQNQFPDPPIAGISIKSLYKYLGKYNSTTFNEGLIKQ